ncbi:hypothetical protein WG915_10395 [Corynebacterium sp. H128]|uniref:hypothetical protein n=1 Tax=unclassified Corynebacterium TaxID=2624378 RepID=UPI0030A0C3F3
MPPKVTDTRAAANESMLALEEETAVAARRIVATYSTDFLDAVTLSCMLGVEPEGLIHRKVAAEFEDAAPKKAAKRTRKKAATKATKKTTKKAATKATKKTTKKATKKTTKKA